MAVPPKFWWNVVDIIITEQCPTIIFLPATPLGTSALDPVHKWRHFFLRGGKKD